MVFSSNIFLFFYLPAVLALYYAAPRKARNLVLFLVSLFFYGWGEPAYIAIMVFTILLNYACGAWITALQRRGREAKAALALSVAANLAVLGCFKYAAFLVRTLHVFPPLRTLPVPEIALPIGISFYIFQSMSYTIDVYRHEAAPAGNLLRFGTYVSMFPQLIAGPIVRYRDVAEQIDRRRESVEKFAAGVTLFIVGLAKKVLLANQVGALWEAMIPEQGALSAWAGLFAYSMQIYFDFSGYSDMALGLGKMLGFEFLKNFNYPYIAQSVTEFWRRWHISLATWFREYVYIPLGGNRRGLKRQILNILIVWSLTGLWHGASWNFVFWGLYYGLFIAADRLFLNRWTARWPAFCRHLATLLVVDLGWPLFYFEDIRVGAAFLGRLFSGGATGVHAQHMILAYLPILLAAALASTPLAAGLARRAGDSRAYKLCKLLSLTVLLLLSVAALATQSYNPFIYFRF